MQQFLIKKISLNSNKILKSFSLEGSSMIKNSSSNCKTKIYSLSLKKFSSNFNKPGNNDSIENIMGESMQSNNYNNNNSNFNNNSSNYNNSSSNYNNCGNNQTQNKNLKRNRLSFLRDGMLLTFYLRKVFFL